MTTVAGGVAVPATYRRDWTLFADWCGAFNLQTLPASPVTVSRFLDFEPHLAPTTLRRRVTAINAVHIGAGLTAPGTVTAIRVLLSNRDRHTERAADIIATLPTSGWPAAMFGRRDALILTLTCIAGLAIPATAALTCGDLTYRPDTHTVRIGAGHHIDITATTNPYGLYAVWRRWAVVRERMIRYPSPRAWAGALHTADTVTEPEPHTAVVTGPPQSQHPDAALFPALDRWGQPRHIDSTESISARAISHILATHLTPTAGRPPTRPPSRTRTAPDHAEPVDMGYEPDAFAQILPPPAVDGAAARRHAVGALDILDTVYTDIDTRTTDLLARTEQLLREWNPE